MLTVVSASFSCSGPAHDSIIARFRTMSVSVSELCERTHRVPSVPCAPAARGKSQAVFPSNTEEQSYLRQNVSDITRTRVARIPTSVPTVSRTRCMGERAIVSATVRAREPHAHPKHVDDVSVNLEMSSTDLPGANVR